MRKIFVLISVIVVTLFCLAGCYEAPQFASPKIAPDEGNIINVEVSSLPERYNYSFSGENAKAIRNYLSNLNLERDFEENPNEYGGLTWVISLEYDDGKVLQIYHFGNMFIRAEGGPWYKMTHEEAQRFEELLDELTSSRFAFT